MHLNWRRGFKRLFLLAAIGWAAYVLLIGPTYLGRRATLRLQAEMKSCVDSSVISEPGFSSSKCIDSVTKEYEDSLHGTSPVDSLRDRNDALSLAFGVLTGDEPTGFGYVPLGRGIDWFGVLIVLGLLVLPPVAMYALLRLGWAVSSWAARGFRSPA